MTPAVATAIAAAAAFTLLAVAVDLRWGPLFRLDRSVDDHLNQYASGHRGEVSFWRRLSAVLSPAVLRTALLVVAAGFLYRRHVQPAVLCAGASLGSLALVTAVKDGIGRPRPTVPIPLASAPGASFPSGHAFTSAAVAFTVIVLAWPRLADRRRWAVALGAVLVALAVGFSRLILGVHFLSDVVGGWFGAGALVAALVALLRVSRRREPSR
jgi:undecaprenyl-diphosphatase